MKYRITKRNGFWVAWDGVSDFAYYARRFKDLIDSTFVLKQGLSMGRGGRRNA